jgi:hypothetical protein
MRRIALLASFAVIVVTASSAQAAVTIESFSAGAASTLAGAHADASTAFAFRVIYGLQGARPFGGDVADVVVKLPPGVVGNPQNVPRCTRSQLTADSVEAIGGCPADTQVGVADVTFALRFFNGTPTHAILGVFNVQPGPNEPAMLAIQGTVLHVPIIAPILLTASARDGYAITATAPEAKKNSLEPSLLGANLTLWAVPDAHTRGAGRSNYAPPAAGGGEEAGLIPPDPPSQRRPFMENPTDCSSVPLTTLSVNTLEEPEVFTTATALSPIPTDCADVPFAPSIKAEPDTSQAGAPAGLGFEVTVPQSNDPNGRGSAELRRAVVTLPQGMTISPSAASKQLQGCTDTQFGAGSDSAAQCPAASQIGTDEVESPLLPRPPTGAEGELTGKVYLGQPLNTNPTSGQMFRVFQELQGFGLDVKVEGSVVANPETGQLTATFANLPELPFQDFKLHFNGGPNAVLVNPPTCGANTTTTQLTPYSGNPAATPSSTFTTSYDGNGAPCPASLPFAPSASISTASSQAGAFSPLTVSFSRGDGTQPLGQITAHLPPGLLGYVSAVPLCGPAAAAAGTCPASSRIGVVSTTAGAGSDPLTVPGTVYLAQGTGGYPFALSVVVPAVAGPYDLGNVVVLVNLQVNSDGSITAVSGPLPSILDGIPLDIRSVTLATDRPGFTFNPTNCAPLSMGGTATSLSGSVAPISAPFQASGCGSLPFAPSFTVATQGSTSKANGASLTVRIAQKPGEADIHSVHVELPKQLPSRLTTLQKACTAAQFNSNPAGCPPGSVVGTATAITPTLSSPLTGPAILVSHGGAAFPDMEIILQGGGVTVILDGQTDIKKSVTSSTFAAVPDVPISGFELTLPEGPYSLLGPYGTLCTSKLLMPTTITGQNGLVVKQNTRIAVTGCPDPKPAITVTKTKAKASSLLVTVNTTAKGTVRISGSGLDTKTKRNVKAGTSQIAVSLTKAGQTLRERHEKLKLRATLTVGKLAVAKTTSVKL